MLFALACSSGSSGNGGTGGAATGGGNATGGSATGGAATGGMSTGGQMATGGQGTTGGQSATGGQGTTGGQMATGGQSVTGGSGQGGKSATGGQGAGGAATGGAGGGAASCADGSLLFCEDFESATSGPASSTNKWMTEVSTGTAAGTLTIDNMHTRGQKALHVHTTGNGRGLIHVKNFAPPSNSFYGRMWLWVDAFPSAPNYAHFTMVQATGTGNSSQVRPVSGQFIDGQSASNSTNVFWGPGSDGGPTGDWTNWKTSAPAKAGSWVCIQWQMDASKNGISLSIDGKPNPDLTVSTKSHTGSGDFVFPMFNDIWFGWWLYQSGPTPDHFDIWLDDLALGTSPIPCG